MGHAVTGLSSRAEHRGAGGGSRGQTAWVFSWSLFTPVCGITTLSSTRVWSSRLNVQRDISTWVSHDAPQIGLSLALSLLSEWRPQLLVPEPTEPRGRHSALELEKPHARWNWTRGGPVSTAGLPGSDSGAAASPLGSRPDPQGWQVARTELHLLSGIPTHLLGRTLPVFEGTEAQRGHTAGERQSWGFKSRLAPMPTFPLCVLVRGRTLGGGGARPAHSELRGNLTCSEGWDAGVAGEGGVRVVPESAPSLPQSPPDGPFIQPACDKGPLVAWKPCELQPPLPTTVSAPSLLQEATLAEDFGGSDSFVRGRRIYCLQST
ncbi:uncharacterized protein LOC107507094 isoform X2 [Rousettus aegyptiacus]|nr:uncharacterized protein LOC107507094 isoform X2 [Rousettus aegyptiacus]